MRDCPVCGGRRKIRLPLIFPVSALAPSRRDMSPSTIEATSKEFACPECSPSASEEKVAILEFGAEVAAIREPGYDDHARKQVAHLLVHELLSRGMIRFQRGDVDEFDRSYRLQGRVGVVSTSVVASMEDRIAARQQEVAREVALRAADEVSRWGSHYTGNEGPIHKSTAIDAINRAMEAVFKNRDELVRKNREGLA